MTTEKQPQIEKDVINWLNNRPTKPDSLKEVAQDLIAAFPDADRGELIEIYKFWAMTAPMLINQVYNFSDLFTLVTEPGIFRDLYIPEEKTKKKSYYIFDTYFAISDLRRENVYRTSLRVKPTDKLKEIIKPAMLTDLSVYFQIYIDKDNTVRLFFKYNSIIGSRYIVKLNLEGIPLAD